MLHNPTVVDVSEQQTASVHLLIPVMEIAQHMDPAIQELFAALGEQGIAPVGPLFSYHFRTPTDTFDFEVGVPIAQSFAGKGRVKPSTIPACRVFRVNYIGPYEGLGPAWQESSKLLAEAGHKHTGKGWETYLSDPSEVTDPKEYVTELNWVIE
jgi:effector-binding domain-containing protein